MEKSLDMIMDAGQNIPVKEEKLIEINISALCVCETERDRERQRPEKFLPAMMLSGDE